MKSLGKGEMESRERIMSVLGGKELMLTQAEEDMKERWMYCDDLIRTRQYSRAQIVNMIVEKFAVSKSVAAKDIGDTHFVFGSTTKYNKNYLIILHIDECDKFIRENITNKEMYDQVIKMYDIRRKYIEMMEKDGVAADLPPVAIQFVLNKQTNLNISMSPEEAMAEARKLISAENQEDEW